jgi:hypothetical protein
MGGKKKDRAAQAKKAKPAARGRDSEDEESETSAMSGTSSDKLRLAQTREELREAGEDTLRMAASHETPTEAPIFGPGNVFDEGCSATGRQPLGFPAGGLSPSFTPSSGRTDCRGRCQHHARPRSCYGGCYQGFQALGCSCIQSPSPG